jgi:uncharacterized membrane protein YkvA (DUF1232 family)
VDADETERRFVETMRGWLISLPHDLKILYEASTDENLDRKMRELAVGAIFYVISPHDVVSDRKEFSTFADDCIVLRLALQQIAREGGEDAEFLKGRFAEFFDELEGELAVCPGVMGELYTWLVDRIPQLPEQHYKSNKVAKYLDDEEAAEALYEDGIAFATAYPVDEKRLADKFKKASTILEVMARSKAEYDRKRA